MSRRQLARVMGIDPASVYRLLHGIRPIRMEEATKLANILGVPVGEVLQHAGLRIDDGQRTLPIAGTIDGIGEVQIDLASKLGEVHPPAEVPDSAIALQVRSAGGPVAVFDGWIYFIDRPSGKGVPADIASRLAVCQLDSGVTLLRFIRRGYKAGTWNLDSFVGAASVENARLTWAQPVLYIRT